LLYPFLTMLKLIQNLSVILADRRRMAAERRNLNVHERKERQTGKDVVQLLWVGHIEYAEIRVPTGHSPQVTPDTRALQVLCTSNVNENFAASDIFLYSLWRHRLTAQSTFERPLRQAVLSVRGRSAEA